MEEARLAAVVDAGPHRPLAAPGGAGVPGVEGRAQGVGGGHEPRLLQGEVDLFLELPAGFALVDHKSFPGGEAERDARAVEHAAQLGLYAFALERALAKPLLAAYVHLPIRGELVEVDVGPVLAEWRARAGAQGVDQTRP
jgi:ATP-dependent exoDNAse (exonuclease V) beta subunit